MGIWKSKEGSLKLILQVGIHDARSSGNPDERHWSVGLGEKTVLFALSVTYFRDTMRRNDNLPSPLSLLPRRYLCPLSSISLLFPPSVRPGGSEIGAAPDYPASFHIAGCCLSTHPSPAEKRCRMSTVKHHMFASENVEGAGAFM